MPENNIKIYGTSFVSRYRPCQAMSEPVRGDLSWCDIEQDPEGCAFVEKINKGKRRVPTIVFPDGTILVEPSNEELIKKIEPAKT